MNEVDFKTKPTREILFRLSVPSIMSMLFSSIYMMADGVFVGRYIGAEALAAVNLVMPVMMIVLAIPNMIAIGSAVKVSMALGEGKTERAAKLFSASVGMVVGIGTLFLLMAVFLLKQMINMVIEADGLAQMAYDYARVFAYALPVISPLFAMDNFLRSCGKSRYCMWVNVMVSLLNIFLDWLFIAVWGRGIEYSAMASVISMGIGSVFSFAPFVLRKVTLYFTRPQITLEETVGIFYNGSSEFFSGIAESVITAVVNVFLMKLGGELAVAGYSVVMYIDALMIGVMCGVLDAVQPAVSYNTGAGEEKRVMAFFKDTCAVTFGLSLFCLAATYLFSHQLAGFFVKDHNAEMMEMSVRALYLFAPSYLFIWYNMVTSAFLTSIDKPGESMIIMIFRAVLFPVVCLLGLTKLFSLNGVFVMSAVTEALTFVVSFVMWRWVRKSVTFS